jgi:GMP synthase (glutamine-hydrolysing)
MTKTALILTHEPLEGPALFGDIMAERGFAQQIVYAPQTDFETLDPSADFLLVMGGPMGVYETDTYPFLAPEIKFIQKWLKAEKRILGICLGSQLMAKALGADVYKGNAGQEIGWYDIKVNQEGQKYPLSHLDGSMFHWHGDTFDLPAGAMLLASSEKYEQQAFQYGDNALALQFHPEVKAGQLEDWFVEFEGQVGGEGRAARIEKLKLETAQNIGTLNARARKFFEEWLESVNL